MNYRLQHLRYLQRASRLLSKDRESKSNHDKRHLRRDRHESKERQRRNQYVSSYRNQERYRQHQEKNKSETSRSTLARHKYRYPSANLDRSLAEILKKMIQYERHHIVSVQKTESGEIEDVVWCPCYISPDTEGHVKGGKARLHHICRLCHRTCLHLLGKAFSSNRRCVGCDRENNWQPKYIPKWYYHLENCNHCKRNRK